MGGGNSILAFCCLLLSAPLLGQSHLSLSVDNDLYFATDYYYSSGIFIRYGKEIKKDSSTVERFFSKIEIGQLIYTPRKRYATEIEVLDYPFSGYLFVRYQKEKVDPNRRGYQYAAELGVSGAASLAEPMQNLYHEQVLQLPPLSWTAAMPQEFHLGIRGAYFRAFSLGKNVAFVPDATAVLSTHQTMGAARLGWILGTTAKMPFHFSPLLNNHKGWGVYFGWQQQYIFHDFPLEGSLFNDASSFTLAPNRARNLLELGAVWHNQQWKLQGTFYSASKDTPLQNRSRHRYLNFTVSRFF